MAAERLPDGIYLVHFTSALLPARQEPIRHALVRANRFLDVEDWADANTPEGYELATTEKQYAYRDLYESQEADVVISTTWGGAT